MKICAVIFNYNLPYETNEIYNKLLSDGFDRNNILVVDNGSEANLKPSCANFILPKNIRFTGQSFITSTLLLEYYDYDCFIFLTTSAKLVDNINYFSEVNKCADLMKKENLGFIAASLFGGRTEDSAPEQNVTLLKKEFTPVYNYQPIATLISRNLLVKCKENNSAYFNLDLIRGWGIDRELQFTANEHGMKCYISKSLVVEWATNLAHKKGVADESVNKYRTESEFEMVSVMTKKYGINWSNKFLNKFNEVNGIKDYYSNNKVWLSYILIKLKLFKPLKQFMNQKW